MGSKTLVCGLGWALVLVALARGEKGPDPFAKWEKEVAGLEAKTAKAMPAPGGVVFLGSSSIRLWKLDDSFPELKGLNHGFGGSQMSDAAYFFDRLAAAWKPRLVVLYAGDNDLAAGKTPDDVAASFKLLVDRFHATLPKGELLLLAVKPSPARWKLFEAQSKTNALLKKIAGESQRVKFVDIVTPMLDRSGGVRADLFVADQLHLNAQGYRLWTEVLGPYLKGSSGN